jgi:glucose uptake protein GlcU
MQKIWVNIILGIVQLLGNMFYLIKYRVGLDCSFIFHEPVFLSFR